MPNKRRSRFAAGCEAILSTAAVLLSAALLVTAARAPAAEPPPAGAAIPLRLPPDRVYSDSVGPDSAVTFSHVTHVDYESNRCTGCHPKHFRILSRSPRITHRDMEAGRSCGVCHDGKHAFDVRANESCGSCHAGRPKATAVAGGAAPAPPAFGGPPPYVFKRGGVSPGTVTFRHDTHRGDTMRCGACHPKLFPMKAVPQDPNADWHEASKCGGCHDGKRSFGVEDDGACGRCHKEGKAGK